MEHIGVFGTSWKHDGTEGLARFTWPVEERAHRLRDLARRLDLREAVYLATCNRVEIGFVTDGRTALQALRAPIHRALTGKTPAPGVAERALRGWGGEGAVEHLFLVTAGLDSARLGETEITGQVRRARDLARDAGMLSARLGLVLEEALKVAARVHHRTGVSEGHVSLAEIALDKARERLRRTPGTVALIGVSPMTRRCGTALASSGHPVICVNRTVERAHDMAAEIHARAISLADFRKRPAPVEVVITATAATEPVLGRADLERLAGRSPSGEAPLCVDLAVPPDVDADEARTVGIVRIGLDEILAVADSSRQRRQLELADCRDLVDDALLSLRRQMTDQSLGPMLGAVQRRYRQTAVEGVERLFRKELSSLGESERESVRRWAETLARRFAHLPTEGLRGIAQQEGMHAVKAFFARSDDRMARELDASMSGPIAEAPSTKVPPSREDEA